jgi:hypothetical protein
MGMNSPRQQEAKHAGTSSKLARLHIGAKLAVQTIPAFSAVVATILRIILGIWCTSAYLWAIVAVAIAGILRRGDFLCIAQYIQHTMPDLEARVKERR